MTSNDAGLEQEPQFTLTTFGVGDGWPSADRNHSSFLYRFQNQCFLIDCGEPVSRSFKATGLDYNAIDFIVLSHLHFDHIGGFFMLIQGLWLEGRTKELVVHAPAEGIGPIRQLLQLGCIFDDLFQFRMRYEPLQMRHAIQSGDVRVTPFPTTHLAQLKASFQSKYPQRFEAFSFLIETGNFRVGHSADIGHVEDLLPLVEKPLDLLVCELAHVAVEEVFRFLQGREIRHILFIHLSRECLANLKEIQALAEQLLGPDRVVWAADGQTFEFHSSAPRSA